MEKSYEEKYHNVEKTHFWFKARRHYIVQLLEKYPRDISILDIGASSGILLMELVELGFDVNNLYAVDISPKAIKNCKINGIYNAFEMDAQNIVLEKKFDIIIASDCLEHLENDIQALKNWYGLLKINGSLLCFVPAFMTLWNLHDVVNMHFRRYRKNELKKKMNQIGFEIEKSSYWNFFLFLPILISRVIGRFLKSPTKQNSTGDLGEPSKIINNL